MRAGTGSIGITLVAVAVAFNRTADVGTSGDSAKTMKKTLSTGIELN